MTNKRIMCLLLSINLFFLIGCKGRDNHSMEEYARVNGELVIQEEINYFSKREKTKIMQEYAEKYRISDFAEFWENTFDGVKPSEELESRAFEKAVYAKIVLLLMKDNGIYDDISYVGLEKTAKAFNEKNKKSTGTVGIKSISLEQFYSYYIYNGELELKNILSESILKVSQDEIDNYKSGAEDTNDNVIKNKIIEEKYGEYIKSLIADAEIIKLKRND